MKSIAKTVRCNWGKPRIQADQGEKWALLEVTTTPGHADKVQTGWCYMTAHQCRELGALLDCAADLLDEGKGRA